MPHPGRQPGGLGKGQGERIDVRAFEGESDHGALVSLQQVDDVQGCTGRNSPHGPDLRRGLLDLGGGLQPAPRKCQHVAQA